MKKVILIAVLTIMAISANAQETIKKVRVYQGDSIVFESDYNMVDSVVFAEVANPVGPEGALPGAFSVAADRQVRFSRGNLQATYNGSSWSWTFATNQWDCIGNEVANTAINGNGSVSVNGTVDLFGWSTDATYYGIHNDANYSPYSGTFVDWGGTMGPGWRTLTYSEWRYLFFTRTNCDNLRGQATVNNMHGYILLPDDWTTPAGLSFQSSPRNWTTNQYSGDDWTTMQNSGAVFLPAAGVREGSGVSTMSNYGYYWSSVSSSVYHACCMYFNASSATYSLDGNRYFGISVRLVQDL